MLFASSNGYCQQVMNDQNLMVISGTVTKLDIESGIVNVQTDDGDMMFYFMPESELKMSTHLMSIIEFKEGDPVKISYLHHSSKNEIISIVDNRPEIGTLIKN